MRKPATEITKLKAWVNNKARGEGRAEWAAGYLRKQGYQDCPEIEDQLERLLQQVESSIHYPRFSKVMDDMKQAWRSKEADTKRKVELVPLRIHLTKQHKQALVGLAKANREALYKAIWRLIDEAGQSQVMAEQRVERRYKARLQAQKSKCQSLENTVTKNTLLPLMRGRLVSELEILKKRHHQLEVAALQWLHDLCGCHVLINDAGMLSPLLPDQLTRLESMFENSIKELPFLGQEIDTERSLQLFLDLGQSNFMLDQSLASAALKSPKRGIRKASEPKAKLEALDLAESTSEALLSVESQVDIEVSGSGGLSVSQQGSTNNLNGLPVEYLEALKRVSPDAVIDDKIFKSSVRAIQKKDGIINVDEPLTENRLARVLTSYTARIRSRKENFC